MKEILLMSIIITYPITKFSVGPFYLVDIFVVSYLGSLLPSIRIRSYNLVKLLWVVSFFLGISTLIGAQHGLMRIDNLVFIYKYCMPILLFIFISNSNLGVREARRLLRVLEATYFFLVCYVPLYNFAITSGWIKGSIRPSFPLAKDIWASDSHLYASYLITFFSYFLSRDVFRNKRLSVKSLSFYSVVFIALSLTGSRNWTIGFLAMFVCLLILSPSIKKRARFLLAVVCLASISFILLGQLETSTSFRIDSLLLRTRSTSDAGRINKWTLVVKELLEKNLGILGIGLVSQTGTWYDSALVNGFVNLGIFGFVYVCFFFYVHIRRLFVSAKTKTSYMVILVVFIVYFTTNIFTEFLLVSRSVVPVVLLIALLQKSSNVGFHDQNMKPSRSGIR